MHGTVVISGKTSLVAHAQRQIAKVTRVLQENAHDTSIIYCQNKLTQFTKGHKPA